MSRTEFCELLAVKPFQPFRVHLRDGRSYEVLHRQLVRGRKYEVDIGIPAAWETRPIYDQLIAVPYEDIERVEQLTNARVIAF